MLILNGSTKAHKTGFDTWNATVSNDCAILASVHWHPCPKVSGSIKRATTDKELANVQLKGLAGNINQINKALGFDVGNYGELKDVVAMFKLQRKLNKKTEKVIVKDGNVLNCQIDNISVVAK